MRDFQRMVRYLGVSDANMEKGSMKCDANISINSPRKGLGIKVELKNMNSPRFVKLALNYEVVRQTSVLNQGGKLNQETRLWNENRDITEIMRQKETSDDYRYFPEPDIPPFSPNREFLQNLEDSLVELPTTLKKRFISQYGLTFEQSKFLHEDYGMASLFEKTVSLGSSARDVSAWLSSDVKRILNCKKS